MNGNKVERVKCECSGKKCGVFGGVEGLKLVVVECVGEEGDEVVRGLPFELRGEVFVVIARSGCRERR